MSILDRFRKKDRADNAPDVDIDLVEPVKSVYNMTWLLRMSMEHGLRISDDGNRVAQILNSLPKTNGYCPCIPKYLRAEDTICPCAAARNSGVCHCGIFDGMSVQHTPKPSSTEVVGIRGNNEPVKPSYMQVIPVASKSKGDEQTLVIQYDERSMKGKIQSIVGGYKRKNATSYIDNWRDIEIFVNLDSNGMRDKPWLRVVYECLDGNPNPSPNNDRFPGAHIIRLQKVFDKPTVTLDMLLEGR